MRMLINLFLALILVVNVISDTVVVVGQPSSAPPAPTYLASEDFENATGYDLTWTEAGTGTLDEDYTTAPAPLVGSQSFRTVLSAQTGTSTHTWAAGAQSTVYGYCIVHRVSNAGSENIIGFRSSGSLRMGIVFTGAGAVRVTHGTANDTTTTTYATGTTVHIWFRYTQGSGADGVAELWTSTNGTKPASSGDSTYANVTTGTSTTTVNQIVIGPTTSSSQEMIFDKIRVDDVSIGSDPT